MDVRRLLMLIFEGWYLKTNLRRGAAFALGTEIAVQTLPQARLTNNVVEDSPVAAAAPRSPSGI